jgi:hypothetical protein
MIPTEKAIDNVITVTETKNLLCICCHHDMVEDSASPPVAVVVLGLIDDKWKPSSTFEVLLNIIDDDERDVMIPAQRSIRADVFNQKNCTL